MHLSFHVLIWMLVSHSLFALTPLTVNVGGDAAPTTGGVSSGVTSGDLRYVLNYANINPGLAPFAVTFSGSGIGTISLNGVLPLLNFNSTNSLSIDGGGAVTIDGGGVHPGFVAVKGSVTLSNLTMSNCLSAGGNGGNGFVGGWGGSGLGGSLLIDQASVILNNMNFTNSSATGGDAGTNTGTGGSGGGGGLNQAAGGNSSSNSGGGGGGMGGNGGAATINGDGGGGGGFGLGGSGATSGAGGASAASGQSGIGLAAVAISGANGATNPASGGATSGGGGGGIAGGGGGGGGNVSATPTAGAGNVGGNGGYGGGGGGGTTGGGAQGGTGGFGGGGGAPSVGGSPPLPFRGNAGYGGGAGGNSSVESFGGHSLGGAIHLNLGGSLTISGSGTISNSNLTQGSPESSPIDYQSGWSIYTRNSPIVFSPASGQTIALTDNFNLLGFEGFFGTNGNFTLTGPGTLSLATSDLTTSANNFFDPSTYTSYSATLTGGTLFLNGGEVITINGSIAPVPIFGVATTMTVQSGAILSGNGTVGSSANNFSQPNTTIIQSGGIVAPSPGLLYVGGLDLQSGSIVQSTITPSTPATLVANTISGPASSTGLELSGASLTINFAAGSYPTTPTVYTVLLSPADFQSRFSSISVTGASASAFYTPFNAPNAIVVPLNIPAGISTANLLVGNLSYSSTVLFDPCVGIVVLSLVLPGEVSAALSSFALNESQLTLQALGQLSVTLNGNISQQNKKEGFAIASPIALLEREKRLVAHAAAPKPLQPASYVVFEEKIADAEEPKQLPWLPSIAAAPRWSLSVNPFGQFQTQNAITTETASFPAYQAKTGGVIAGCDFLGFDSILLGGAATYAYTNLNVSGGAGHQRVNSVFGTIYNGWILNPWAFNFVVTGSYHRNDALRNIFPTAGQSFTVLDISVFGFTQTYTLQTTPLPGGSGKAKYDSYQLASHFDVNYELGFDWISLFPFITSDWIINFESTVTETGAPMITFSACGQSSSLNTTIQSVVSYMLQNEAGINLFEQVKLEQGGTLIFRQKGSYVNRYTLPYVLHSNFVSSPAPFTSTLIKLPMQHLFGSAAEMVYRYNFSSVTFTYEGMVGSGFMFHAGFIRYTFDF